jgi:spermidine/putrescine transport system permease protein
VPVVILEILTGNVDPQINAIGSAVFLISITLVAAAQLFLMSQTRKPESAA